MPTLSLDCLTSKMGSCFPPMPHLKDFCKDSAPGTGWVLSDGGATTLCGASCKYGKLKGEPLEKDAGEMVAVGSASGAVLPG